MFTRAESSRIKQEFWTTFGKYMRPIPSAEGLEINWINYHTKIKDIYFRMTTDPRSASIYISLEHNDPAIRDSYFEQFLELKTILHTTLEEEWDWQRYVPVNGKVISKIGKELPGISVFNKNQWPELISFFKPRMIALDSFWENARYSFEGLRER
jgi:hypothetical protein